MKKIVIILSLLFVLQAVGAGALFNNDEHKFLFEKNELLNEDTEYWALLVGVSENMKKPWHNAENKVNEISTMDLYHQLLQSNHWQPDHIRVLTGKNASWLNIYRGLQWLDEMDDEDDICFFYIATHGGQRTDIYPKDEEDGLDEYLMVYDSDRIYFPRIGLTIHIPFKLFYLVDDEISYLLSQLDAQGICAFFDTCYSGGFNDNPSDCVIAKKMHLVSSAASAASPADWTKELARELAGPGRIVIAASSEGKLSQSYGFIHYFLEAFQGYGDTNSNGVCTAEEAFSYAAPLYKSFCAREMNFVATPQIFDNYPEELPLAVSEYPPYPVTIEGPVSGQINTEHSFMFSADDFEGDMVQYLVDWGDGTDEVTSYYSPGVPTVLSHHWETPGTYNVWFESEDEHGVSKWSQTGFPDHISMTIAESQLIDQRQTQMYGECCGNDVYVTQEQWFAQSFVPTKSVLSQVDLQVYVSAVYFEPSPFIVSVRDDLKGEDLTSIVVMPQQIHNHMIPMAPRATWTTFDFPDIEVIPGKTYYILCRCESEAFGGWGYAGVGYEHDPNYCDDPYPNGNPFISRNQGDYWKDLSTVQDFCFVTYGE